MAILFTLRVFARNLLRACQQPLKKNIEAVKKMIWDNRRVIIREGADDVGISFGLCQAIFTDVLGSKDCSKIAKF